MRQSGDWEKAEPLGMAALENLLLDAVKRLDIGQVKAEVAPFVQDHRALDLWSREFFADVVARLLPVGDDDRRANGSAR